MTAPKKPKIKTEFTQPLRVSPGKSVLVLYGQPDTVSLRQDAPFSSPSCKRLFNDVVQLASVPFTDIQQYCILHERCLGREGDAIFRTEKQLIADDAPKLADATYTWFKQEYMLSHYWKYIELLRHILQTLKPSLIIAADKWALFFLAGLEIEYKAIVKSDTGVTGTWRGSHMQLAQYYTTTDNKSDVSWPHVMMPIISIADLFATNANWHTHKLDMARFGQMYANYRRGELQKSITREEHFLIPPEQATPEFYEELMGALAQIAANLATSMTKVLLSVDIEHLKKPVFIDCIGIATSAKDAITVPIYTRNGQSYWSPQQEEDLYFALKYVLEHKNAAIIGQNFNYDSFWFRENLCLNVVCTYDTMTLHHSMFPALEKNLGYLSSMYCEHHLYWKNEIDETKYSSPAERWAYNCKDTTRTFEICQNLLARIEEFGGRNDKLLSAIQFQMQELHPTVRLVGNRGFDVDTSLRGEIHQQLYEAIGKLEAQWKVIADAEISSSSPLQLAHFLYKDLGLEVPKVTKASANGLPTSEEAMVALMEQYPLLTPVLQVLLDVRSLRVFQKTFIEAKTSVDGKMRTVYNIDGTDTFRFSSRKLPDETGLNLQNLPKGGKTASGVLLPNVRKLLIPPPGYGVFDTDFDSADLRVVVAESGCREMQSWLDQGLKPYLCVAQEYHKDPTIDKYHPAYKMFKAYCHGCLTEDHEVLTKNGWVKISEKPTELAAWSPATWGISFESVSNWIDKESEDLYQIEGAAYSQRVTGNHKMTGTTDSANCLREYTANALPKSARLPYTGYYSGGSLKLVEAEVILLAALQADGNVSYITAEGNATLRWHFTKERKILRLLYALEALYIPYTYKAVSSVSSAGNAVVEITCKTDDCFLTSGCKYPGYWMLEYDQETLSNFLGETLHWDGSTTDRSPIPSGRVRHEVSTTRAETAEVLQTIAHLCGKASKVDMTQRAGRQALYRISYNARQFHSMASGQYTKIPGKFRVYCPTVPSGYFLVRRNGHISVTGNSNYMGSAAGLAKRIGLLVHESEKLQKWYFQKFPEIHGWHKRIRAQVDGRGYIENCFGYRFVFYDKGRHTLYQQACAWIPQSTVACLVNRAMVSITKYENPEELRVLLQVHDSLAGLYRLDVDPKATLKKHMELVLPYAGKHIIIPADAVLSIKSWGDCE